MNKHYKLHFWQTKWLIRLFACIVLHPLDCVSHDNCVSSVLGMFPFLSRAISVHAGQKQVFKKEAARVRSLCFILYCVISCFMSNSEDVQIISDAAFEFSTKVGFILTSKIAQCWNTHVHLCKIQKERVSQATICHTVRIQYINKLEYFINHLTGKKIKK